MNRDQSRITGAADDQDDRAAGGVWVDLVFDDLEDSGYACAAIAFPSAGVGAPHIRDRLYWVANSDGQLRNGAWLGGKGRRPEYSDGSAIDRMADGNSDRCKPGCTRGATARHGKATGADSGASILGNTGNTGLQERECIAGVSGGSIGRGEGQAVERTGVYFGGLADAKLPQSQRFGKHGWQSLPEQETEGFARDCSIGAPGPGPTNGYWADADWLYCRDDKWRPVEPSTFPLAHGAPARVGRLRGYGNAINARAAQAFIESVMEATC